MGVKNTITQAARTWLKTSCGLSDEQVIKADQDESGMELPYLTVKVIARGGIGDVEDLQDVSGGVPRIRHRGHQFATISVQGRGETTDDWLEHAKLALRSPAVLAALTTAGVTIHSPGDITDLSGATETGNEERYLLEVEANYSLTTATPETEVALDIVEVAETFESDQAPDITRTLSIEDLDS